MQQCACSICTSEGLQCIEVLHCNGTANALQMHCISIWAAICIRATVTPNRSPFGIPPGTSLTAIYQEFEVLSWKSRFVHQIKLYKSPKPSLDTGGKHTCHIDKVHTKCKLVMQSALWQRGTIISIPSSVPA